MSAIEFSNEEKETLVHKLSDYFRDNFDQELGQFDGEFMLDFISKEIGPYYYNRGLFDARAILESRLELLTEAIYEIEKPTDFIR